MKRLVVGLLAHVDSGKTTLAEGLLYRAGVLRKLGRVDHRDAFLDTDSQERARGITIFSKQALLKTGCTGITLLDTRKTSPNNRIFEKYAVRVGGGSNHRTGLSDGVLLKDNHIGAAGGVAKAVKMARQYASFVRKIEVEVETLEQVKEAVEAGADIIMLDNMSDEDMRKAVTLIAGRAKTECSGNVTRENIARLRDIGIDYVSSGALTHSAPILDLSMKHLRPLTAEEA